MENEKKTPNRQVDEENSKTIWNIEVDGSEDETIVIDWSEGEKKKEDQETTE